MDFILHHVVTGIFALLIHGHSLKTGSRKERCKSAGPLIVKQSFSCKRQIVCHRAESRHWWLKHCSLQH